MRLPKKRVNKAKPSLALIIKTNEGGLWIVPQVEEALSRGMRVTVILPSGDGRLYRTLNLLAEKHSDLFLVPLKFDFQFKMSPATIRGLIELRKVLKEIKPTVVFYHLYASALAARLSMVGMRDIYRVHMVAGPLYLENKFISFAERILCRMDSVIIAGSEYTRERYLELEMPRGRLEAVPYGVDVEHFSPGIFDRNEARRELGLAEDAFIVVMVAYVYAPKSLVYPGVGIKGHELILAAWNEFSSSKDNVHLVFVGSGFGVAGEMHRVHLKNRVEELGIADSITWIDSVDDVRQAYSASDLSVSPSLSENHGALLEASAMGIPSIVSDAGALPEATSPLAGWIFPRGNMEKLKDSLDASYSAWEQDHLNVMGDNARNLMIEEFSRDDCVARIVDILMDKR